MQEFAKVTRWHSSSTEIPGVPCSRAEHLLLGANQANDHVLFAEAGGIRSCKDIHYLSTCDLE